MFRIVCFVVFFSTVAIAAEHQLKVAVLEFNAKNVSKNEASVVSELFMSDLVATGKFIVLDRANMSSILKEQELQQSGCTETACAVKLGKVLNVERMFTGTVMKVGTQIVVAVNMIKVETSQVVDSRREQISTMNDVSKSTQKIAVRFAGGDPENFVMNRPFDPKPWLYVGAGIAAAGGITCNILGFSEMQAKARSDVLYSSVTNLSQSALATQYYNESESHRSLGNIFYIIAFSSYAVSAGLTAWAIFAPSPRPAFTILPTKDADGLAIAFRYQY